MIGVGGSTRRSSIGSERSSSSSSSGSSLPGYRDADGAVAGCMWLQHLRSVCKIVEDGDRRHGGRHKRLPDVRLSCLIDGMHARAAALGGSDYKRRVVATDGRTDGVLLANGDAISNPNSRLLAAPWRALRVLALCGGLRAGWRNGGAGA